jgi:serine/threonine protein kinase/tetratricopeptide (TPR) repeat protein
MGVECPKCKTENTSDSEFCKKCATPLPSSKEIPVTKTLETPKEELTTGSTFAGRYQIIEELGKGGMGKVYKAQDTDLKEKVAIKLLKPEIAADKKTIERFRNELKFARKIRHKNVCQMYDLNKEEGSHYITMEYVAGEDLKSMIRMMGQLSSGKTIFIAKQVCEGLAEAHRLGVVHRDLKPQNIMIDKDGNTRIMDFGIARSLKTKGITAAGMMIGTPEYMSPEQVEGKEVDQRSDIYSLGVILYEMVTGRVPFEGDTPFTIGMKHKGEEPKDPKELNTQLPEDLNLVILRCLEKDKEKRYQSAGEVRAELTRIEKGIPTTEIEIPKKKPLTSREITVTFGLKKLFIPAIVVVALIIAAVIIWQLLPKKEAIPAPSDKPSLAVMYFINDTGDEALDHWRVALSRWLITDISQSKHINVLSADRLFSILRKLNMLEARSYASEDLKNVANEGRVNHVFQASISKAGDIFRVDYSIQKADTLEMIASDYVTGKNEESFPSLVDDMTRKIKANLKISEEQVASDIDKEVGKITTSSPEAYKYYSIGMKYRLQGEERKSIPLMEKATAIDPEFAMAYRSMGIAYGNLGYRSKEKEILQKALELVDKLSERERYQIEGDFYSGLEKTYDKAIVAYNNLLQLYPDDQIANHNLGRLYGFIEEWDKSTERYEFLRKNKTDLIYSYTNLAGTYTDMGLYDKAKEILEEYINNFSDNAYIHICLADNYRYQGEYDLALKEMDKAFTLAPTYWLNIRTRGEIYFYRGDLSKAEEEYRKLLEKEELAANAWGLYRLAGLFLLQGRFRDSVEQANKGLEHADKVGEKAWIRGWLSFLAIMDRKLGNIEEALKRLDTLWKRAVEDESLGSQRNTLYEKGLSYLEMKSINEAQREADKLKEMIGQGMNKKLMRQYYHLMGRIELEKTDYSKAIEYFKKGLPLLSVNSSWHVGLADSLALAYYKVGDSEKAREEYERITSLTTDRLNYGDIYAKSFYMLGKIYEEKDWKGKAIEHYQKFLDLWKDADPGIVEVEDAKKRLAGLKS